MPFALAGLLFILGMSMMGCAVALHAEGCDVLVVEWEGIRKADALPVEKPP